MTDLTVIPPEELARVRELLPWYANQSLNAEDATWLQTWLSQHQGQVPEIMAELVWIQLTIQQVRATIAVPEPAHGLDTLLNRIQQAQPSTAPTPKPRNQPVPEISSWWQQRWSELQYFFTRPVVGMACAALVIAQMGVIGRLTLSEKQDTPHDLAPLSGGVTAKEGMQFLQITFRETATEGDIRKILQTVDGTIVAGPGALGIYTISIPQEKIKIAFKTLQLDQQNQRVIDSVQKTS